MQHRSRSLSIGILFAAIALATAVPTQAQGLNPVFSETVGSGSQETFLTIDFKDGTSDHNFAFDYKYDGKKTGADLLNAFAPDLQTQYLYNGGVVNGFSFDGHSEAGFAASGYWSYYHSTDGLNWTTSRSGVGNTIKDDGWDGWSWSPGGVSSAPLTPIAPVPEASTTISLGILLSLSSLVVLKKRKAHLS